MLFQEILSEKIFIFWKKLIFLEQSKFEIILVMFVLFTF